MAYMSSMQQLQRAPRIAGRGTLGSCKCRGLATRRAAQTGGAQPLGALGLSLLSKIVKMSTPGPNEFKLQSTPKEIKSVIAKAGPVLSVIPGWGALAAAGASVITAADQRQKAQRLKSAGSAPSADLLKAYQEVAGVVPGRVIGIETMLPVWQSAVLAGLFKGNGNPKPEYVKDAIYGCKACGGNTIADQVPKALAQGVDNPFTILDSYSIPAIRATAKDKWSIPTGDFERQIMIDAIDAAVAGKKPDAPLYYGKPAPDAPPVQPVTSTGTPIPIKIPTPISSPVATTPITPTPTTANPITSTPAAVAPSAVTGVNDPALQAYIKALIDQGASQQQAFTAALAALGNSGSQVTPQVQAAVADQVQAAGAGTGLPPMVLYGAAALAVIFALAHPTSKSGRVKRPRRR